MIELTFTIKSTLIHTYGIIQISVVAQMFKTMLLFIDIIRFNENKSNIFSIDNRDILYLFIKLSTRELLFSVFHFTKIQITIVGGWDLSFAVFYNNKNDFNEYLSIARKNELFFRNIETIS